MTVTISYIQGFLDDCNDTTDWGAANNSADPLTGVTLTVVDDDFLKIGGTCDAVADEYVYYENDITNISTDTYPYCFVGWKTSASSNGLQAKVEFVYTVGSKTETLGFATSWTTTKITLDSGKTLDKIRIYADDNPDSLAAGTFYVYYDFLLVGNQFTFPYVAKDGRAGGVHVNLHNDIGELSALQRSGSIIQDGGLQSPTINLSGDMDTRSSWLTTPIGKALYYVITSRDSFHWFESDLIACKVAPVDLDLYQVPGTGKQRLWNLMLKMYSRSSGKSTSWGMIEWLGF